MRLGTIEVTRLGMQEPQMAQIADFMTRVLIEKQSPESVMEDVVEFRPPALSSQPTPAEARLPQAGDQIGTAPGKTPNELRKIVFDHERHRRHIDAKMIG